MNDRPRQVLYVCHNHPRLRPGGAEAYALELYQAMRDGSAQFEPFLLAAALPPVAGVPDRRDTPFAPIDGDPHQYFFINPAKNFDPFLCTAKDQRVAGESFRDFLLAVRPDVVHFQHTLALGYDLVTVARQVLPEAAIVYTLHEYLPICHHHGQMVRTFDGSPCTHASPQRCHACYPRHSPADFSLRRQAVQAHFEHVDLFLAPSRFLLDKFVEWGIPPEKIRFEEYGRRRVERVAEIGDRSIRNRLAFFGQFTPFKGADVLLQAMTLLPRDLVDVSLRLHGANLELQSGGYRKRFNEMLAQMPAGVTLVGRYTHDQLPRLMSEIDWVIVPSIWWENSPLVIQESFAHGRPVICSGLGGMKEKVRDGVDGLHFAAGDAASLAHIITTAVSTPGLWDRLAGGIAPIYDIAEQVRVMEKMYEQLLSRAEVTV